MFPPIPIDEYQHRVAVHDKMKAELAEALTQLTRLRGTRRVGEYANGVPRYSDGELTAAMEADEVAQVEAKLAGDPAPPRTQTKKVAKELTAVEESVATLTLTVDHAERDVHRWLAEHHDEAAQAVGQELDRQRDTYRDSIDAMMDARDDYWRGRRLEASVRSGQSNRFKGDAQPPGLDLPTQNGDPHPIEPILSALRAEVTPPAPAPAGHWEQYRERDIRGGKLIEERYGAKFVPDEEQAPARPPGTGLHIDGVPVFMDSAGIDAED